MKKIIGLLVLIGIMVAVALMLFNKEETSTEQGERNTAASAVEVVTVGELEASTAPVVAYGQVVSSNSVAVVPEISGVVKRVYKTLGQTVRAGETVLELQNSSEQQAVLQARSSLSSSQASLQRVNRGANADQIAGAEASLSSARAAAVSTETSVLGGLDVLYTELDTIITSDFSEFFNNPNTTFPSFTKEIDSNVQLLEQGLADLNTLLEQDRQYDDARDALGVMEGNIDEFQKYTNELRVELTKQEPSASLSQVTITRWGTDLVNVRNDLESKKVTLRGLESQLLSAENAVNSASKALEEIRGGADVEDISIAQSGVSGARAGLSSAQIQLAKTIIKAPTFGRVSSIDATVGQLVGPSSPVFILSSSDAKRIDIYLTEKDVAEIQVGASVIIDGEYEGTVARISPTIDAQTGKVKVEIFADETITLTEGVGVGVAIERSVERSGFTIPIEAVFVRGGQAYVYAVVASKAVPTPVETGGLFGPTVVVTSGVSADTSIVSFARVVKDNQIITEASIEVDPQATSTEPLTN